MADVFTKLPGSPAWSLLFFSMLLSLGLGSQIGILEGMISTLFEMPQLKNIKKPILTGRILLLLVKFRYSEKLTKIWKKLSFSLTYLIILRNSKFFTKIVGLLTISLIKEWWNMTKFFPIFDSIIHANLTAKMCKKFNSQDGFLKADQGRAKNCCQIGWIGCLILQVAQKATIGFHFRAYFCNPLNK